MLLQSEQSAWIFLSSSTHIEDATWCPVVVRRTEGIKGTGPG